MITRFRDFPYPHGDDWKEYALSLYAALTEESRERVADFLNHSQDFAGPVTIYQNDDTIVISLDGDHVYFKWSDGSLYLETDEGDNTNSTVGVRGKGTGYGQLVTYDEDNLEWLALRCVGGTGIIRVGGTAPGILQIGGAANYTSIAQDGEINLVGTARVKNCDWIGAGSTRAPGAKPATFVAHGIKGAWEFANAGAGNEEMVSGTWKIPCSMDMSVAPTFYIGWSAAGASPGNCVWQFEYLWITANDDTTAAAQETLTPTPTAASATANGLTLTGVTGIDLPGATDKAMFWRVTRKSDSGSDTIAAVVHMHGNYMEYTMSRLGEPT